MDIVAVPGRLVRDPATRRVVGEEPVTINPAEPYWARLIADRDVAEAPEPTSSPPSEPANEETEA
ncbi:DUF2635 domain-containing protein [Sphingomonas bacterium]|uniref:DUF2635 domain-containing protein n=1 Tax=Sphingomonas bacterium TaxID=1895847 RepID=UPI00157549DC|nr:DUF2635 domain-containing protein [Sphingomonas bacterium]